MHPARGLGHSSPPIRTSGPAAARFDGGETCTAVSLAEDLDPSDVAYATRPVANNDMLWGGPSLALLVGALILLLAATVAWLHRPTSKVST